MYQKLIFVGNLGRDPEARYMPDGRLACNFSIAVNNTWNDRNTGERKQQTTWVRVSAFGRRAETAYEYLQSGHRVLVEGRLRPDPRTGGPRVWVRQDGSVGASYEITADAIKFMTPKGDTYDLEDHRSYQDATNHQFTGTGRRPAPRSNGANGTGRPPAPRSNGANGTGRPPAPRSNGANGTGRPPAPRSNGANGTGRPPAPRSNGANGTGRPPAPNNFDDNFDGVQEDEIPFTPNEVKQSTDDLPTEETTQQVDDLSTEEATQQVDDLPTEEATNPVQNNGYDTEPATEEVPY